MDKPVNAIILNGRVYNFVKDEDTRKCERCAINQWCERLHDNFEQGWQSICETLFEWPFDATRRFDEITIEELMNQTTDSNGDHEPPAPPP